MNLNEMIATALSELGRGHDQMNIAAVRQRFTRYANDAVADIVSAIPIRKNERVYTSSGKIFFKDLSCVCLKVNSVFANGKKVNFCEHFEEGFVDVFTRGYVDIDYRFVPKPLESAADIPDLPEHLHGLIVMYIVGRERMCADTKNQGGARLHLQLYETMKSRFQNAMANTDTIINKW